MLVAMSVWESLTLGGPLPDVCEKYVGLYRGRLVDDGFPVQVKETATRALDSCSCLELTSKKQIAWFFYNLAWFCENYDEYAKRRSWLRRNLFAGMVFAKG